MTKENTWRPTEKNVEDYSLLIKMLQAQRKEFDLLSNKKPNEQLNKMKIKMLNRVLKPLHELLKNEPSHIFLDLPDEDDLPTNSDVVLIVSQYEKALKEFENKYHLTDPKNKYRTVWNTKENPIEKLIKEAEERAAKEEEYDDEEYDD